MALGGVRLVIGTARSLTAVLKSRLLRFRIRDFRGGCAPGHLDSRARVTQLACSLTEPALGGSIDVVDGDHADRDRLVKDLFGREFGSSKKKIVTSSAVGSTLASPAEQNRVRGKRRQTPGIPPFRLAADTEAVAGAGTLSVCTE